MTSPTDALPNEILASALALLTSRELVAVAAVGRRFYAVAARLLHQRLAATAGLPDHSLLLKCCDPSYRAAGPFLQCRFLGTTTADGVPCGDASRLGDLARLYSSFRPVAVDDDSSPYNWRRPPLAGADDDGRRDEARQHIALDRGELFSQLCVLASVVRRRPRPGLYVDTCDGVVRVWRAWLADMAAGCLVSARDGLLWLDAARSVGLRVRVVAEPTPRATTPPGADEPAVAYTLVYQGAVSLPPRPCTRRGCSAG
ncbi:hypothetical protein CDD83_10338 [Cordyceps sp. RAO-2017]|nr:hypothetical protein CDD83_10338 [Cordyceps sp. RAO-2017]